MTLDYGVDPRGFIWWIRPYAPCRTLRDVLQARRRPLRPRTALSIAAQILACLAPFHKRSATHNNLKPSNILLFDPDIPHQSHGSSGSGQTEPHLRVDLKSTIQLIDFHSGGPRNTLHGEDAVYAAPECLEGGAPSPCSDVYAVGAILFEMLTGRPPFLSELPRTTLHDAKQAHPLTLLSSNAGHRLDGRTARLIIRSMTSDQYRYEDASVFLSDLLTHSIYIHPSVHDARATYTQAQRSEEALRAFAAARTLFLGGNLKEASTSCMRSLRLHHPNPSQSFSEPDRRTVLETYRLFARVCSARHAPAQAIDALNRALALCNESLQPIAARLYEQRAWVSYERRDLDSCHDDLNRAERLTPPHMHTRLARLRTGRALCALQRDDAHTALSILSLVDPVHLEGIALSFYETVLLVFDSLRAPHPFFWPRFDSLVERLRATPPKHQREAACLMTHLHQVAVRMDDFERALGCLHIARDVWTSLHDAIMCVECLLCEAEAYRALQQHDLVQRSLEDALSYLREQQSHHVAETFAAPQLQRTLYELIMYCEEHDHIDEALLQAQDLCDIFREERDRFSEASLNTWLVQRLEQREHPRAVELARSTQYTLDSLERDLTLFKVSKKSQSY